MIISKLPYLQAVLQAVGINDLVFAFKDGFFSKKRDTQPKLTLLMRFWLSIARFPLFK